MVKVKPFAAVRPPKDIVTEVAAPPYDVLNSEEAQKMAGEKSLLHITKPEGAWMHKHPPYVPRCSPRRSSKSAEGTS